MAVAVFICLALSIYSLGQNQLKQTPTHFSTYYSPGPSLNVVLQGLTICLASFCSQINRE